MNCYLCDIAEIILEFASITYIKNLVNYVFSKKIQLFLNKLPKFFNLMH